MTNSSHSSILDQHEKCSFNPNDLVHVLRHTDIFFHWSKDQLVSLVPFIHCLMLEKGEFLCRRNSKLNHIYLMLKGQLDAEGSPISIGHQPIGLASLAIEHVYHKDIEAVERCQLFAIPRELLPSLQGEDYKITHSLMRRLSGKQAQKKEETLVQEQHDSQETPKTNISKWLGWFLVFIIPAVIHWLGYHFSVPYTQNYYLTILSGCLILLLFELVPQYAAVLLAALICLLLDVVPVHVVLSGFASGGFFLALSIFGLGAVLIRSGLAMRLILLIINHSPPNRLWHTTCLTLAGVMMTPCLPSVNSRISLMTPLVKNMSRSSGYQDKSPESSHMILSMFVGCSIFSPIFLTGKSLNFVLYNMLPQQVSAEYQWLNWLLATTIFGMFLLITFLLFSYVIFKKRQQPHISKIHLQAQLMLKGSMDRAEWISLIGIVLFVIAITNFSFHKINMVWIGFGFFCLLLVLQTLTDKDISNSIEWDTLLLIGFFIGLENALDYTGISDLITSGLKGVTSIIGTNYFLFLLFNIVFIFSLRIFLPITTAGVLAASVCLPLANLNGLDPWLSIFIILTLSECWFWPKQASYYGVYTAASGNEPIHHPKYFHSVNLLTIGIRIAALVLFIVFLQWQKLI